MSAAAPSLTDALPRDWRRRVGLAFPLDWNHTRGYRLPAASGLGSYYLSWDAGSGVYGEDWLVSPRDPDGVLLTHGRSPSYHPIRIAQYALHAHDAGDLDAFLAQARWLRDGQDEDGAYRFPFPWPKYGAPPGWRSAMGQGEAISVLLRAEIAAPGEGFAEAAARALRPFERTLAEGGVTFRSGDDVFFEEAAVEPAAHILNGGIYAVFGLWDLVRMNGPLSARALLEDGVATLLRRLESYDADGRWSYYSALRTPRGHRSYATLKYHAFHVAQLQVLAAMTGEATFRRVAERWDGYRRSMRSRLAVVADEVGGLPARFVTRADTVPGGARGRF